MREDVKCRRAYNTSAEHVEWTRDTPGVFVHDRANSYNVPAGVLDGQASLYRSGWGLIQHTSWLVGRASELVQLTTS